jgi:hypothetical protein
MGIDTRYWGPSGWQLFHWISFHAENPEKILGMMKDVLPCKFCRKSTAEFTSEKPLQGDPGKWLYDLHNMVNHKLRTQCKDDPNVVDPGPDPSFEEVKEKYENMKLRGVLGRDFLFSVAVNYPEEPTESDMNTQRKFMDALSEVYPTKNSFDSPDLANRKAYMKWMYGALKRVSPRNIPSYRSLVMRTMYYKSGCDKKTYKGKTCRRMAAGGATKVRDHTRTFRVTRKSLL